MTPARVSVIERSLRGTGRVTGVVVISEKQAEDLAVALADFCDTLLELRATLAASPAGVKGAQRGRSIAAIDKALR